MALHAVRNRTHVGRLILDTPLFFEGLQGFGLNVRVAVGQHQHRWCTYTRSDEAKILCGIEEARIPALPRRQQALDLFTQAAALSLCFCRHSWPTMCGRRRRMQVSVNALQTRHGSFGDFGLSLHCERLRLHLNFVVSSPANVSESSRSRLVRQLCRCAQSVPVDTTCRDHHCGECSKQRECAHEQSVVLGDDECIQQSVHHAHRSSDG